MKNAAPRRSFLRLLAGSVAGFAATSRLRASSPPPPSNPIRVYEIGQGNAACGPAYQIRLRFAYDGVVFADKTFENGQKMELPRSGAVQAGKVLRAEMFIITKATGAVKAQSKWENRIDFNGSTGWSLISGAWADRPYFRWTCNQAEEYHGEWLLGFRGEQQPAT